MGNRKRCVRSLCVATLLALLSGALPTSTALGAEQPKVRAVTAFVRMDRANAQAVIGEALVLLRRARGEFEKAGYQVESIRISTQPFPEYTRRLSKPEALAFFRDYDSLAVKENFEAAIGPAMLQIGDDPAPAELVGEVLAISTRLNASLVVAGEDGIHADAVSAAAGVIKFLSEHSSHSQGAFSFSAIAMVPPLTPFYPGSYHLGPGHEFAVALESANVVAEALAPRAPPAEAQRALAHALGEHTQAIEAVALRLERATGWKYDGIDLSPAPLKDVSIGGAIERYTGARFGSSGTLTAASVITGALRAVPVKRTGYSGLMLPILEDSILARRWSEGGVNIDALLAYSAVCGTGLDVIPLPGEVSREQLERIITDMASLAVKLRKPLSARLLPVAGKKAGDQTEFSDPFLVNATIHALP